MTDVVNFPADYKPEADPNVAQQQQEQAPQKTPEERLAELEKRFADTQAELTRKSQALAEFEKAKQGQSEPPKEGESEEQPEEKAKAENELEIKKAEDAPKGELVPAEVLQPFYEEYQNTKDVSQESREQIAQKLFPNVPKDSALELINSYIESAKIRDAQIENKIFDEAGGRDSYKEIVGWAGNTLSKEEVDAYNRAVNSGDFQTASLAVSGLRAKFERANGRVPKLLSGDIVPGMGGTYKSMAEVSADMSNPLYKSKGPDGEAFRNKVRDKMARSNI